MKIIATGLKQGIDQMLVVEISENELANLIGFYWHGEAGCPKLVPGLVVRVSEMFRQLYDLKSAEKHLADSARTLRAVAEVLQLRIPIGEPAAAEEGEAK